jgi:glycosyltransferase involved in cell wall biosynthesis
MMDRLISLGVPSALIRFIPNWADERLIVPVENTQNSFRHCYGLDEKFIVMYAGNIGIPQYFEDLLAVAGQMAVDESIMFVFVGDGVRADEIRDQASKRALRNVLLLPFMHDKFALAEILSAADVHFVSLRENLTGVAVPSKAYGALAAGRPLIYQGSERGEIARMIRDHDIGTVVRCGDHASLRKAILDSKANEQTRKAQGQRARQLAEGRYGRQLILQQYENLFLGQEPTEVQRS